jgi:NTP pyrophosphatase (non-canonical NTP hydrolase)
MSEERLSIERVIDSSNETCSVRTAARSQLRALLASAQELERVRAANKALGEEMHKYANERDEARQNATRYSGQLAECRAEKDQLETYTTNQSYTIKRLHLEIEALKANQKILSDRLESFYQDGVLTLGKYQERASETAVYPGKGEIVGLMYAALGLAGESGEVCNKVKKIQRDSGGLLTDEKRDALKAEVGDCLWYLSALANELGASLDDIARENLSKLQGRKDRGTLTGDGDKR